MMEVVLLGANGFGPGALKAVRALLEAAVTAEYIRIHPEECDDFFDWEHVERFKEMEFLRKYLPRIYARLVDDGDFVQRVEAENRRVGSRFGNRRAWCRHDLAQRAQQTGYLDSYRVVNPTATSFVHVTCLGFLKRFEAGDDQRIGVPPGLNWVMQAFVSGHSLTLGMVHTLIRSFSS